MGTTRNVDLPGRLGNPDLTLGTDPPTDPRLAAGLAAFGIDGHGEPSPVDGITRTTETITLRDLVGFAGSL